MVYTSILRLGMAIEDSNSGVAAGIRRKEKGMKQEKKDFIFFMRILAFSSFACAVAADREFRWCFGILGFIFVFCAVAIVLANRRKIN